MDPRITAATAAQHGLISRRQLERLHFTGPQIRRMRAAGELVLVRRGWWTTAETWAAADDYTGRLVLRTIAAGLNISSNDVVFSHESAGYLQELPMLRPSREIVHVTRPGVGGGRGGLGIKQHPAAYRPSQVVERRGLRCLDLARTAVDIGREHGYLHGLAAADAARHRGVSLQQLEAALAPMRCWPGVTAARAAVADSRDGAESIGETLTRVLVKELGLAEEPETQFPVLTAKGVVWCDLRVGNHVFEFHGRIKLLPPELGGVAQQEMADVVTDASERASLIRAEGLGLSDLLWDDVWGSGRSAALRRIGREWRASERAFGATLNPSLAAKVAHLRGGRRSPYQPA